jgi:predicted RNA-binding protein associated with RNAse of E/G family
VRSQLYVALDQGYINPQQFDRAYDHADKASRQIHRLIQYLQSRPNASRVREDQTAYCVDLRRDDR